MKIESVKAVCFSPTRTGKAILEAIIRGFHQNMADQNMADHASEMPVEFIDITRPATRKEPVSTSEKDLLVMAVPVYMGRVPAVLEEWFQSLTARNTPAVCVVVYGNREYDDALLELKNLLADQGCLPVAGAACIGEHSYSTTEFPTAHGRPDCADLDQAEQFGRDVRDKLISAASPDQYQFQYQDQSQSQPIEWPGNYPYGGATKIMDVDFIEVTDACIQCKACAIICPVNAIDPENCHLTDINTCINCCACSKNCPVNARIIKEGAIKDFSIRLNNTCSERKEPVFIL